MNILHKHGGGQCCDNDVAVATTTGKQRQWHGIVSTASQAHKQLGRCRMTTWTYLLAILAVLAFNLRDHVIRLRFAKHSIIMLGKYCSAESLMYLTWLV